MNRLLSLAVPLIWCIWRQSMPSSLVFYFALSCHRLLSEAAANTVRLLSCGPRDEAWIAGLSFLSANLGALELMGWAGAAYQYGILAAHWYWIGAIPAMLFLTGDDAVLLHLQDHSVPGYLKLRYGESSRLVSHFLAFMTVLMSGINMYSMALVMKVVLGWTSTSAFDLVHYGCHIRGTGRLRSAIFNEVLNSF